MSHITRTRTTQRRTFFHDTNVQNWIGKYSFYLLIPFDSSFNAIFFVSEQSATDNGWRIGVAFTKQQATQLLDYLEKKEVGGGGKSSKDGPRTVLSLLAQKNYDWDEFFAPSTKKSPQLEGLMKYGMKHYREGKPLSLAELSKTVGELKCFIDGENQKQKCVLTTVLDAMVILQLFVNVCKSFWQNILPSDF